MKLWPTPTPANGVIHHPKESEQFFPKKKRKKERKRAAPQQPPNPERARFPAGVPASGIESNGTRRPAGPHPSVARAAAPPHRQRGPRGGRGSPPRRPPRHASGDVPGKRPYNLRGRRAPRAGDAAPTHAHGPRPRRQPPNPNAGDRRLRRSSSRPRHACGAPGL